VSISSGLLPSREKRKIEKKTRMKGEGTDFRGIWGGTSRGKRKELRPTPEFFLEGEKMSSLI